MKSHAIAYGLGLLTAVLLAVWAGGEAVTQVGLRLAAAESHYDWQAAPRMPEVQAAVAPQKQKGRSKR